jgi:hypothetical protein
MRMRPFGIPSRALVVQLLGMLAGAGVVVAAFAGYRLTQSSDAARVRVPPTVPRAALPARSGVRLVRVSTTGGGGLLDLRYQVVDADRAQSVHDAETPPIMIDERSGLLVSQLFMGHMHHGQPKPGVSYYLIFLNPGNIVRAGSRVTVQLGDARVPHVVVQ